MMSPFTPTLTSRCASDAASARCARHSAAQCQRAARRGVARHSVQCCAVADDALESLIPSVIDDMESDEEYQELLERMKQGQEALTREESDKRQRSLDRLNVPPFQKVMKDAGVSPLTRSPATILQLNIGLYCNQACTHCHVESSPKRTEMMDHATAERCLQLLRASPSIKTLDITGGAPELNSEFEFLVREASKLGVEIIDRCNLTVLMEPGQEHLPQFLAEHNVRVVASLPCYSKDNVDAQRGGGVFRRSIAGLQKLNAVGYAAAGSPLTLDLVYNPAGAFLAPSQATLEPAYRQELLEAYGIRFSSLLCLNNMPIKRFTDHLVRRGELDGYMQLLVENFNPAAGEGVMCRDTVSVSWDGSMYDCDFNQQLALGMEAESSGKPTPTVWDVRSLDELTGRRIACGNHCFGCTAGSGSSCQGQ